MNSFGLARSQFHPALPHYDCAGTVFDILTVGPHNIEQKTELSIHCRPREMVKMAKLWDAQVGCAGSSFCVGGVKVASLAQRHHRQSIGILLTSRCRLECRAVRVHSSCACRPMGVSKRETRRYASLCKLVQQPFATRQMQNRSTGRGILTAPLHVTGRATKEHHGRQNMIINTCGRTPG